jgi:predicted GIY-YIG superfamily endonuclease
MVAYVYVACDAKKAVLVGVTLSLVHTLYELKVEASRKTHEFAKFDRLVHFERYKSIAEAHRRKQEMEAMAQEELAKLIEVKNPNWKDLGANWFPIPQQDVVETTETPIPR